MSKINIFVYGTLRPGEYNDRGFSGLAAEIKRGTTQGRMHNRQGRRPVYPVVDFDAEGTIIGDLLVDMPERHPDVRSVHRMEIGAGYEMREITVDCDGEQYQAIAYHFDAERRMPVGVHIESGDWLQWAKVAEYIEDDTAESDWDEDACPDCGYAMTSADGQNGTCSNCDIGG